MSDSFANSQLELACRIGAINDLIEALEDGADINYNGGSPIFIAIMAGERRAAEVLVERGADVSMYLPADCVAGNLNAVELIDMLMACGCWGGKIAGAKNEGDVEGESSGAPAIDSKLVGAIDRMIRRNGLREPFLKKRGEDYPAFRAALGGIGAEDCHAVVSEFLDELEAARSTQGENVAAEESAVAEDAATERSEPESDVDYDDSIFLDTESERIAEWSTRYLTAEESPADLAKEYLKERKKLEADA